MTGNRLVGSDSALWGVGAIILAVSLIGTVGTASELGPDSLNALTMAAWRGVIGAAGLLAVTVIQGQAPWRYRMRMRWLVLGGLGLAVANFALLEAVARTGVAIGTLAAIGVGPTVAGLIDWLALRHRPTLHWLTGVVIALSGVGLISGGSANVVWSGVVFGVLAGCGIPCQGFAAQQLMADRPLLTTMATIVGTGALIQMPIALSSTHTAFVSTASTATVTYLGLMTVTVAFALWGAGLKRVRLSTAVVVGLLEPVVATTLAVILLQEPFTATLAIGICLVIIGVGIASLLDPMKHKR